MKTSANKKTLILIIAFTCCIYANGQQYPDSLIKYLEIASKYNPTVQQRFIEYKAALQKVPQVGSLSDPELSVGVFLKPMELVTGNQLADIRLMQMFPWFGVLKYAKDEMSLMANAKFELFRDAKLQVCYDVQRTWYELFKIQKDISISEKNIEILKIIERLAVVKMKSSPSESTSSSSSIDNKASISATQNSAVSSGMQTMNNRGNSGTAIYGQPSSPMQTGSMGSTSDNSGLADLYRIEIEAGDLDNNIALLKNQQKTIIALFNTYLNRPVVTPVFTYENIATDTLGLSLVSVSDTMLSNNPMLGMIEYERKSIEARKKMVNRMGYPMFGLGLNYSLIGKSSTSMGPSDMNGKDMLMPMVTVTLPIYRKKYNAMSAETELLKNASSLNFEATSNSLQVEYYQAVQLYQDAHRRIKLFSSQYQLASKSLDLILKSFTVASSGLNEVLRIRQQTLDYEFKQVEAIADFNIAIAWLKRLGNMEIDGNRWK